MIASLRFQLLCVVIALIGFGVVSAGISQAGSSNWTGTWDTFWPGGSARLTLVQEDERISGSYEPGGGRVEGTVSGLEFTGRWTEERDNGTFVIDLSGKGDTFFGHFDGGEWWTGSRVGSMAAQREYEADRSSPRAVLRSFLIAGNAIRNGELGYARAALSCLMLESAPDDILTSNTSDLPMLYFDVLDNCTLRFKNIPDEVDADTVTFTLSQAGSQEAVAIHTRRGQDGAWRLVIPAAEELKTTLRRLFAARGQKLRDPTEHLELKSPRATMRTFLEEYKRWDDGGREYVARTLDLTSIPALMRNSMLPMMATYLKQTLDRVGYVVWQQVPDDPERTIPYIHFRHPRGSIVIAPVREDSVVTWKFTAETMDDVRGLYEALEDVPLASSLIPDQELAPYFYLNHLVRRHAPGLTGIHAGLEDWQWFGIVLTVIIVLLAAAAFDLLGRVVLHRAMRRADDETRQHVRRHALIPLAVTLAVWLAYACLTNIGLPLTVFPLLHALAVVVMGIGLIWTFYSLAGLVQEHLYTRATQTVSYYDDLLVALIGSAFRAVVVIAGLAFLAREVGIPLNGVLAGLGVGGLAIAIAARDTLANVFGSAVILADRPFSRGDLVVAAGHEGYIMSVGLRSTQMRTEGDSVVSIPNSVLANEVINNMGKRRQRRVKAVISVTYDTHPDQLEAFAKGLRETMEKQPRVRGMRISAGVRGLADSSIEFEISCYLDVPTNEIEREERHRLFLDIVRLAEEIGVRFAFPTRTIHFEGMQAGETSSGVGVDPNAAIRGLREVDEMD
jgi:small-conductance mechanosensitive channel